MTLENNLKWKLHALYTTELNRSSQNLGIRAEKIKLVLAAINRIFTAAQLFVLVSVLLSVFFLT